MESHEKFGRADFIALGLMWIFLLIRCALLGGGLMWADELYAFRLIHDPSVGHALTALGDQADGAPPLYYLMARLWGSLFSADPMPLRMFSTFGFAVGLTLLWVTMRRVLKFLPTLLVFALVFGPNETVIFETLNIRFYGLLFALLCLATFLALQICRAERTRVGLLLANGLTNAALCLCHPLGGFYGAALLGGIILVDLLSKPARVRPWVILSYVAGWMAVLLWFEQFLRQADINSPHGWIPIPGMLGLFGAFYWPNHYLVVLLFVGLLLFVFIPTILGASVPLDKLPMQPLNGRRAYLLIGLALIGVMPLFWVFSRLYPTNCIFLPRYLIGLSIGWTLLLGVLVAYILEWNNYYSRRSIGILSTAFVLFAAHQWWGPVAALSFGGQVENPRDFLTGKSDLAFGHDELPIVCPRVHEFWPRSYYGANGRRYHYVLNWQAAIAPQASPAAVSSEKLAAACKRYYPDAGNIEEIADFLQAHPSFLVLDVSFCNWVSLNLDPRAYKITHLKPDRALSCTHDGEWPLLLVEKLP